jgi:hypothetical protein
MSEGRIIEAAVMHLEEHEEALEKAGRSVKDFDVTDWIGFVKGGPKTNATEELDEVVYGQVGKP